MTDLDRVKLLHGPYHPPLLRVGDREVCLLRDCLVVITGISNARIPWPRCRPLEGRGGVGLWLGGDLARAVQTESAAAVMYWWRASSTAVHHWRRALGVTWTRNEGTRRLRIAAARLGAATMKEKEWTEAEQRACAARSRALNSIRHAQAACFHRERAWKAREVRLLGRLPDAEVARRTGRDADAVRVKRQSLGIPNPQSPAWTADEMAQLGTDRDSAVAAAIGRTVASVRWKRRSLGIPIALDLRRRP